jgi:hypothetical protein
VPYSLTSFVGVCSDITLAVCSDCRLVAVQNDLLRRFLQSEPERNLQGSSPLSYFGSLVFERSTALLTQISDSNSVISSRARAALADSKTESKALVKVDDADSTPRLHPALQKLFDSSNTIKVLMPFLVANLTALISNGAGSAWIEELGHHANRLLKQISALNTLATAGISASGAAVPKQGYVSTLVESPHPYDPATRKRYNIAFEENVSVLVCVGCIRLFSNPGCCCLLAGVLCSIRWPSSCSSLIASA